MGEDNREKRTLVLGASAGISGDMTVAALLDLGADSKVLTDAISTLPLEGFRIEISRVKKSALDACDFRVILDEEHENHDHDMVFLHPDHTEDPLLMKKEDSVQSAQECGHHHAHHHGGRNLDDIEQILRAGRLTPRALQLALKIFRIVAEAEASVHGIEIGQVHFHEVGAVDSIIDIAAAAVCLDNLGITDCVITDLTEGTGTVMCQHGMLPVPVPAVTQILQRYMMSVHIDSSVRGELITPTGAAIAAAIMTGEMLPERFKIERMGLGAGKRDYKTAGVLRAMLIREEIRENSDLVDVLQTNVDDCSGEALSVAMELLLREGALDVFYTPIFMKKNRPAYMITVLCEQARKEKMEEILFCNTTTIGIRCTKAERTKLARRIASVETPWGMADVKVCRFKDETFYYPESDSVVRIAQEQKIGYDEAYHRVREYAQTAVK